MNDKWYDYFLETLSKKYPKKKDLAQALIDLLCIEREAVYRRLRKEVIFPAHEIVKIASEWNISLDRMVDADTGKISFQLRLHSAFNPSEEDMKHLEKEIENIENFKTCPNSEYMVIFNNLSRSLAAGFEYIYQFNVFKWAYLYRNESPPLSFSQIILSERLRNLISTYYQNMKYAKNTSYIFEHMVFEYIVRDIQFFHSILLITDEEKALIKKDLHALLDYLLEIANTGCFPESGNKVQLYVSMINVNTNYSCFYTDNLKTFRVHTFNILDIYTFDLKAIERFRIWMQLMKRTSIQISEVDERSRIEFFAKQRQLIEEM